MPIKVSKDPRAFREFELAGWNEVSEDYEGAVGPLTAQAAEATLDAAGVRQGSNTLDVCTGPGVLARAAIQRGAKVSAIDFAEAMIVAARRNALGADCRQGDAQELPFADNTFDAVVCGFGIMHVPEPDRALAEMRRVIRPGGRVAISVWERLSPSNGLGVVMGALRAHGRFEVRLPHGPDVFQFGDPASMKQALTEAAFDNVDGKPFTLWVRLDRASELLDTVMRGTVDARALLRMQDPAAMSAITTAVVQGVEKQFRDGQSFRVPMPVIIGSGTKG